jgi:hypothetical protein
VAVFEFLARLPNERGAVMQNNDVPAILLRLEAVKDLVDYIDVEDCRELSQLFQDLSRSGSPYADRVREILKQVMHKFTSDQLRIQ